MKKIETTLQAGSSFSARDLVVGMFRHKLLIFLTLVTTAASVALFAYIVPSTYESRMKILVRNARSEAPLSAGEDKGFDRSEVSEEQITSEIELLKSRDLLDVVVRKQNLAEPLKPGMPVTEADIERAVVKLEKDLSASPVKKANIIDVSYSSKNPETAAAVLKTLSEAYLDKHLKLHRPPGAYEFFKNQADQHEAELRDAENKLSEFQQSNNAVDIDKQKELLVTRLVDAQAKLKELDGSIDEGNKRISTLEAQLKGMERRITTQARVLPNQYSAERLNTMLIELRNRRVQLLTKFQPDDRAVKEVDEQIAQTTEALQRATDSTSVEQSTDVNPLRTAFEGDLSRARIDQAGRVALRKSISEQVATYEYEISKLENATAVHSDLSRQVKKTEDTYQLYAKKQEELRISEALDDQKISNVSVAEAPVVPRSPNNKNRTTAMLIALGLGLGLGFGAAFVSEVMRDTFHTARELEGFGGLPVLATIALDKKRFRRPAFHVYDESEADFGTPAGGEPMIFVAPPKTATIGTGAIELKHF